MTKFFWLPNCGKMLSGTKWKNPIRGSWTRLGNVYTIIGSIPTRAQVGMTFAPEFWTAADSDV